MIAVRTELERMVSLCDGVHQTDCALYCLLGRAPTDAEIADRMAVDGRSYCSCGSFALRQGARLRFGLSSAEGMHSRRDTEPVLESADRGLS
ncbi:MAG TPA: hypothetical protein VGP93_13100 [Polyangiaceae bacterium]|nr:hypothetical protein [Polyangiaceae bacterium]